MAPLFSQKRTVHYVIIGGRDVKSAPHLGNMSGSARDRSDRAPHPPRRGGVGDRASFRPPPKSSRSSITVSGSCRQAWCEPTAVRFLAGRPSGKCLAHPHGDGTALANLRGIFPRGALQGTVQPWARTRLV